MFEWLSKLFGSIFGSSQPTPTVQKPASTTGLTKPVAKPADKKPTAKKSASKKTSTKKSK